jgi:hypothetical protein
MHINDTFLHAVINGEWEALGEATVITIYDLMDSAVYEKRIDICEQGVKEVRPKTSFSTFVEAKSLD